MKADRTAPRLEVAVSSQMGLTTASAAFNGRVVRCVYQTARAHKPILPCRDLFDADTQFSSMVLHADGRIR